MKFFKPEDFTDQELRLYLDTGCAEYIADAANDKLICEGKIVYGKTGAPSWFENETRKDGLDRNVWENQKALLINIEQINCTHPIESIKANDPNVIHGFTCICGQPMHIRSI